MESVYRMALRYTICSPIWIKAIVDTIHYGDVIKLVDIETIEQKRDFSLTKPLLYVLGNALDIEFTYVIEDELYEFIENNQHKILELYENHKDDDSNPVIWDPALYLVLHQLENNKFRLKEEWEKELPVDLLISIADEWGVSICK